MGEGWIVGAVPSEAVVGCAELWMPLVSQALPKGEWDLRSLTRDLREGRSTLFLVSKEKEVWAAGVVQVVSYPLAKKLRVFTLAGRGMEEWKQAVDDFLQSFARTVGAVGIELVGRKGFSWALKPLGYTERYIVMEKEVIGNGEV